MITSRPGFPISTASGKFWPGLGLVQVQVQPDRVRLSFFHLISRLPDSTTARYKVIDAPKRERMAE